MRIANLESVFVETNRLLERVASALKEDRRIRKKEPFMQSSQVQTENAKDCAAIRRASMEVTRALAKLRQEW